MKFFSIVFFGVLLVLFGFGCSKTLDERLVQYEAERLTCIEKKQEDFDLTFNGQKAEWSEYERQTAEYSCSTVDLAKKYYRQDPEGIIELCVRTNQVGDYTSDKGLGGAFRDKELEILHSSGMFLDVTIDSLGKVIVGESTLENWRGLCKSVIENVVGK